MAIFKSIKEFFDSKELRKEIGVINIRNVDKIDSYITKILANVDYISEWDVLKEDQKTFSFVKDYNDNTINITVHIKGDTFDIEVVNGETVDMLLKTNLSFDNLVSILNSKEVKNIIG